MTETGKKWPPLVGAINPPPLIRLRDVVITGGAWCLLAYLLRDVVLLVWDYLSHPIFELTVTTAPDWPGIWQRLAPFAGYSAALIAWLLYWAYVSRHRLADASHKPQPPALMVDEHAQSLGLSADQVRDWQTKRSVVVHFDAAGNIAAVKDHS